MLYWLYYMIVMLASFLRMLTKISERQLRENLHVLKSLERVVSKNFLQRSANLDSFPLLFN